jgi:hypothetical protein
VWASQYSKGVGGLSGWFNRPLVFFRKLNGTLNLFVGMPFSGQYIDPYR